MNAFFTHLKSLAWFWRHATSATLILFALWNFSGPFIEAYAADALLKVLKENGVDPDVIEEMKQQGVANGEEIGDIKGDVQEIQETINKVSTAVAGQAQSVENVERLVQELVRAQLNRRTGTVSPSDIPPFPGEAPPE